MSNIQSLRGMKDILNEESERFTYFIENASRIAKNYGFSYIETLPKSDQVQDIWHDLNVYQHTIESKEESQ